MLEIVKEGIDVKTIIDEIGKIPLKGKHKKQVCLQGQRAGDDPYSGIGRLKDIDHLETDYVVPLFNIPYTNSIIEELGMYRTRIMLMPPYSCYSMHQDPTKRIHIPLITDWNCFFVINRTVCHLAADGKAWIVDTTLPHTFINSTTSIDRFHIVGCI